MGGSGASAGATAGGRRGGVPLSFERRKTSKDRLKIGWDFPASIEVQPADDGPTRAQARMFALEREEAFARLSGDDRRPLLVVRECNLCKGTDDALLSRTLDNERTLVLSRWFHCVKLMHHVVKDDHTFAKLFEGDRPPHLFLASADGSNVIPLPGTQPQSELWKAMERLIELEYRGDTKQAVKGIFKVLATYDQLDSMEDQLREQLDLEIEKRGPKSPKVKRLRSKLAGIEARKKAARQLEEELSALPLREPEPEPAGKKG